MTDTYNIYLQNQTADLQTFWCFLAPPPQLIDDPYVFASSSIWLHVPRYFSGTCQFAIPIQYVFGAGAGNEAVGNGIEIVPNVVQPVALGDTWNVTYAKAPPTHDPIVAKVGTEPQQPGDVVIETNVFDMIANEKAGWFSNQSFAIQAGSDVVGMTWSPFPNTMRILTPQPELLIAVGDYGSNVLAPLDEVTANAAVLGLPSSFDPENRCTATLTASGLWTVTPGPPD